MVVVIFTVLVAVDLSCLLKYCCLVIVFTLVIFSAVTYCYRELGQGALLTLHFLCVFSVDLSSFSVLLLHCYLGCRGALVALLPCCFCSQV